LLLKLKPDIVCTLKTHKENIMAHTRHLTTEQVKAIDEVTTRYSEVFSTPQVLNNHAKMKAVADQMTDDKLARIFGLKFEFDGQHIIVAL
jgi:hypothetical protein